MLAIANPVMMDQGVRDQYSNLDFNDYHSFASTSSFPGLPYSDFDTHSLMVGAQIDPMANAYMKFAFNNTANNNNNNNNNEQPPSTISSSVSAPSIPSATSSNVGSPYSGPTHAMSQESWAAPQQGLGLDPAIITSESFSYDFPVPGFDPEIKFEIPDKSAGVDPSLIQSPHTSATPGTLFTPEGMYPPMQNSFGAYPPISSPSHPHSAVTVTAFPGAQFANAQSPQLAYTNAFDAAAYARPPSAASHHSFQSHQSPQSATFETDEEGRQRGRCPHPDCGKVFKDLKAHMLTHQSERPEKCPILTCEYNQKGFARKYDKNRHTLTHYKGTMVCGFCPGSGSAAEKSFNRADVFKRHLTSVHGVEQTPPNSRKRSPGSNKKLSSYCQDATGKCSTCSATFNNAQDFYEHLDDCVLRVVQQEEPSEAINQQHLTKISADDAVKETLDRHMLNEADPLHLEDQEEADDDDDEDDDEEDYSADGRAGKGQIRAQRGANVASRVVLGANSAISKNKGVRKGLTLSKGGVPLVGKSRKKRKHYPPSWGMSPEKMKMKKRVLCVYDGERRLWKDDMMLDNEFEVRMKLADGKSYVTDLDVETLKRAEAIHNATEERGHWIPDDGNTIDFNELMA